MIETRWAKPEDLVNYTVLRKTSRVRVALVDGELAAVLGYFIQSDTAYVFSEIFQPVPKKLIIREARAFMNSIRCVGLCVADKQHPGACRLLEYLGWRFWREIEEGRVYTWRG